MAPSKPTDQPVILGRFGKPFGVKGFLKVFSDTSPFDNILTYSPWLLCENGSWHPIDIESTQIHGDGIIAKIKGIHNCDAARRYTNCDIGTPRNTLPPPEEGKHYWIDLIGLQVISIRGADLGIVDHMIETGANDNFAVQSKTKFRYIPNLPQVVKKIDLEAGTITVDWDPEF